MNSSVKLRLYEMADELEEYSVDNGPMGEDYPFKVMAKELRKLAKLAKIDDEYRGGHGGVVDSDDRP